MNTLFIDIIRIRNHSQRHRLRHRRSPLTISRNKRRRPPSRWQPIIPPRAVRAITKARWVQTATVILLIGAPSDSRSGIVAIATTVSPITRLGQRSAPRVWAAGRVDRLAAWSVSARALKVPSAGRNVLEAIARMGIVLDYFGGVVLLNWSICKLISFLLGAPGVPFCL